MEDIVYNIMSLTIFKYTGEDIGKVKNENKVRNWQELLPKYCVGENGKIFHTNYYHQFTYTGSNKYYLFNLTHADRFLEEEIQNCGIDELFTHIDFNKLFDKLPSYPSERKFYYNNPVHIVVKQDIIGGYCYEYGCYELDRIEHQIISFLDASLNQVPISEQELERSVATEEAQSGAAD